MQITCCLCAALGAAIGTIIVLLIWGFARKRACPPPQQFLQENIMSKSTPSLLALLGLVAVAGYQNRSKIEMLSDARNEMPGSGQGQVADGGGPMAISAKCSSLPRAAALCPAD